jgi:hypothetical protein
VEQQCYYLPKEDLEDLMDYVVPLGSMGREEMEELAEE